MSPGDGYIKGFRSDRRGFYDHDVFVALLAEHGSRESLAITAEHEYAHHHLAVITSHGRLLQLVVSNKRSTSRDGEDEELAQLLSASCRKIQESFATYVSIRPDPDRRISSLSDEYKKHYRRMSRIVDRVFDKRVPAMLLAEVIAIICMMNGQLERCTRFSDFSYQFISSTLPKAEWPDKRFKLLRHWSKPMNRKNFVKMTKEMWPHLVVVPCLRAFEADSFEALKEEARLAGQTFSDFLANCQQIMQETMITLTAELLPELREQFDDFRALKQMQHHETMLTVLHLFPFLRNRESVIFNEILLLMGRIRQRVQVVEVDVATSVRPLSVKRALALVPYLRRVKGTVYLYMRAIEDTFYSYIVNNEGDGVVFHRFGSESPEEWIDDEPFCCTIVLEERDYPHYKHIAGDDDLVTRDYVKLFRLCGGKPFVHVRRHAGEFIAEMIASGALAISMVEVKYDTVSFNTMDGLEMILYETLGESVLFFQLSNPDLGDAVRNLIKIVDNENVVLGPGVAMNNESSVQKLIDHPVLNYYLLGSEPPF
jgi:hypothetical protein